MKFIVQIHRTNSTFVCCFLFLGYKQCKNKLICFVFFPSYLDFNSLFFLIYNRAIEDDVSIKGINNVGSESSNDATLTGNLSANAKLLSDLTPPVTPDSTPMSIGNSPNFKQQPQSFLLLNQSLVTKKHVRNFLFCTILTSPFFFIA